MWLLDNALLDAEWGFTGSRVLSLALIIVFIITARPDMDIVPLVNLATRERSVTQVQSSQKDICVHCL